MEGGRNLFEFYQGSNKWKKDFRKHEVTPIFVNVFSF